MQYRIDFAMTVDSKVMAWLEVKCRNRWYPEMILSAGKFTAGQQLAESTNRPFVVAFCVGTKIVWRDCTKDRPDVLVGGRTDRHDWQDMEPVVMMPTAGFRPV